MIEIYHSRMPRTGQWLRIEEEGPCRNRDWMRL
jgi:hypothetical protein